MHPSDRRQAAGPHYSGGSSRAPTIADARTCDVDRGSNEGEATQTRDIGYLAARLTAALGVADAAAPMLFADSLS
jgi:hypothetical protein